LELPSTSVSPARVCGRSGFWGASSRLLAFFLVAANVVFFFFGSSTSRRTFEGLHCEHRPASTVVHYFEQHTMLTHVNGAIGALSMGPSAGYSSNLTVSIFNRVFVLLNMINIFIIVATSSLHMHIFVVTNLLLFIWIKLNMKIPKFLTTRPHCWAYSVPLGCYALQSSMPHAENN
jgi:hypothetical protein